MKMQMKGMRNQFQRGQEYLEKIQEQLISMTSAFENQSKNNQNEKETTPPDDAFITGLLENSPPTPNIINVNFES